jgi:hypothetical protein
VIEFVTIMLSVGLIIIAGFFAAEWWENRR